MHPQNGQWRFHWPRRPPFPSVYGHYNPAHREKAQSPRCSRCFAACTYHEHKNTRSAKALLCSLLYTQRSRCCTRHTVNLSTTSLSEFALTRQLCLLATGGLQKAKWRLQMLWEQTQGQSLKSRLTHTWTQNHAALKFSCSILEMGWHLSELELMISQTQQRFLSHPSATS